MDGSPQSRNPSPFNLWPTIYNKDSKTIMITLLQAGKRGKTWRVILGRVFGVRH